LTAAERARRDELEERRRNNETAMNEATTAARRSQQHRAAELAARYALPAADLHALLEEHREALAPHYAAVADAAARCHQAQAARDRAAALAREKAAEVERLEAADEAAFAEYSRACEAAISTGDIPVPYAAVIDVAALHAARVEARAAANARERLGDARNVLFGSAMSGPERELEAAVDRLVYERHVAPRITRLRAAFAELQELRSELWGYKVAGVRDASFAADTVGLEEALDIKPVLPGKLPEPVERAACEWRERRRVLIAGDLAAREFFLQAQTLIASASA
jgi:hypothetical protein